MKHILLTLAVLMVTLSSLGSVKTPEFYSMDFASLAGSSSFPADGWITYGTGAVPTDAAAEYFDPDGDGPAYVFLSYNGLTMAMANTEFADGSAADEWLVSPEIEIPYDNAALLFTACAFSNGGQSMGVGLNNFKVLVSESGTDKQDFTEVAIETGVRGSTTSALTTKKLVAPLNGFKGKKIHVAFVTTGAGVGLTGFANLQMGQYILEATNYTTEVADLGESIDIDVNVGIKAPVECGAVEAVLAIDGKTVRQETFTGKFGNSSTYILVMKHMLFDNAFTMVSDTPVEYTLTLTPSFEGAEPSVISGWLSTPGARYPKNVVVEELTATGCGYCPRGTAALEYYKATFPGDENTGKAITIAIHGYMGYYDPMNEGVESYLSNIQKLNGTAGLPSAIFNRTSRGLDPSYTEEMKRQIAETSYNTASILEVYSSEGPESNTTLLNVRFNVRNGYNASDRPLNASVVIVENNVQGNNTGYNQTNYFADYAPQDAASQVGADLAPYIIPYMRGGEYGYSTVPAALIQYQHVARGIFPDFEGSALNHYWESDVAQEFEISFGIPATVTDIKNTEVILLITEPATQAIVASDIMDASRFADSGVGGVSAEIPASVVCRDGVIAVATNPGAAVALYDAAGMLVTRATADADGNVEIPVSAPGIMMVTAGDSNGCVTRKVAMF